MAAGAFLFIPAASAASYTLFLGALMVLAAGITVLQVAANPYVAVLGPPQTASSRLNLTQAFNSLGTTIGPWIGGIFILTTTAKSGDDLKLLSAQALQAYKVDQASSVKTPYLFIGLLLVALAVVIYFLHLPSIPEAQRKGHTPGVSLWKYRHLVLGVVGIFVYVGAEVAIGTFLIKYFHLHEIGDLPEAQGARLVAYYWGGAMIGRFIGSANPAKSQSRYRLGHRRVLRQRPRADLDAHQRPYRHGQHHPRGLLQFHHVSQIFTLGIAELGPLTGDGSVC